jgi:hypothetical protein
MRNLLVTLPDRLKLARRALRAWWDALVLRWIDRYLAERDEERVPVPLDFEELEVLYDEVHIPVLFDEAGGWAGNPWPETAAIVDYEALQVL